MSSSPTSQASTLPTSGIRSSRLRVASAGAGGGVSSARSALVEGLLREQKTLTAVDRFSRQLAAGEVPAQAKLYRDLIPFDRPKAGEQYAFEVDLDACTGCKACVAACHSLNGLDDGEVWRTVGLLHGGTKEEPAQRTVTTSCHHCIEPACMSGCPVQAYEKDPSTGIVKHLDDQCIGCQYCTFMCPYDAPKYSTSRGIVRKCDMCSGRLAVGEAPACVQACPSQAIRIKIVEQAQIVDASQAGSFLPGAPAPEHTLPTTNYKTSRQAPANLLPADFYRSSPEHAHMPLVALLVFTQLAVGAYGAGWIWKHLLGVPDGGILSFAHAGVATGLAVLALLASALHLGRPLGAWRVFLGLRTSWMSREAIAFGGFVGAAVAHCLALASGRFHVGPLEPLLAQLSPLAPWLEWGALFMGIAGVICSVMIYAATRRSHWRASLTGLKFFGSVVVLGVATVNALTWTAAWAHADARMASAPAVGRGLLALVLATSAAKLLIEVAALSHLRGRAHTVMKRAAILMVRDLRVVTLIRFVAGAIGGVVLPLLWLGAGVALEEPTAQATVGALLILVMLIVGELCERYLFFAAAPPSRMPGGLA
jgi:Fe-S-cluster-containing dehydrogenase component/DMSO reductase anchor subunit